MSGVESDTSDETTAETTEDETTEDETITKTTTEDEPRIENECNDRSLGIATVYNLLADGNVTENLTLAADLWAVEQDIVNTIDHPIIGIVGNAATLAMGTNPIVKLYKDFPEMAVKLLKIVGGVVGAVVLIRLVL